MLFYLQPGTYVTAWTIEMGKGEKLSPLNYYIRGKSLKQHISPINFVRNYNFE